MMKMSLYGIQIQPTFFLFLWQTSYLVSISESRELRMSSLSVVSCKKIYHYLLAGIFDMWTPRRLDIFSSTTYDSL